MDEQVKQEQQTRVTAGQKQVMQEQLVKKLGAKTADSAMEEERERRVESSLDEGEIKRRVNIAHKMLDVQKELLATHQPTKVQKRSSTLLRTASLVSNQCIIELAFPLNIDMLRSIPLDTEQ